MITKAIERITLVANSMGAQAGGSSGLGGAMRLLIDNLLAAFDQFDVGDTFTDFAPKLESALSIISNVGGIITTFAAITAGMVRRAIKGLLLAAQTVGIDATGGLTIGLGAAMKTLVESLMSAFKDFDPDEILTEVSPKMESSFTVVSSIGNILTQFSALTAEGIVKAIAHLDRVSANAPQIANALVNMAKSLKVAFEAAGINEEFADSTDAIGRVMDTVSSVFDFATSMTEENIRILTEFAAGTNIIGDLWGGVGAALSATINELIGSINIIPDVDELAKAQTAIEALSGIFSSLTGLMQTVPEAEAWLLTNPPATPPSSSYAASGGLGTNNVQPTPEVSGVSLTAKEEAGGGSTSVSINITWSTLTGEPSEREKRQLVEYLKPELDRLTRDKTRTSF